MPRVHHNHIVILNTGQVSVVAGDDAVSGRTIVLLEILQETRVVLVFSLYNGSYLLFMFFRM